MKNYCDKNNYKLSNISILSDLVNEKRTEIQDRSPRSDGIHQRVLKALLEIISLSLIVDRCGVFRLHDEGIWQAIR